MKDFIIMAGLILVTSIIMTIFTNILNRTKHKKLVGRLMLGTFILYIVFFIYFMERKKDEEKTIAYHIENLDQMSKNMTNVQTFISQQKQNLLKEQAELENLKKEKDQLEKILKKLSESERELIEAVFMMQERRQKNSVWIERAYGFVMGIFSSLIASFIRIPILNRFIQKRQKQKDENQ